MTSGKHKPCRYDYIFINEEKFPFYQFSHRYEDALEAGSDHALIMTDILENEPNDRKKRLSAFSFSKAHIPIGSILEFAPKGEEGTGITCIVKDDAHVEFDGKDYSLTALATELLGRPAGAGPKYFTYEGERVFLRRRRMSGSE